MSKTGGPARLRRGWLYTAAVCLLITGLAALVFPGLPPELPIIGRTGDLWLTVTVVCMLGCGFCGTAALFESSHVDALNIRGSGEKPPAA